MKKNLVKKALAVTLSAAMALSMLPLSGRTAVSAKAPFVKLNTSFKTLTVGQAYKLKLKNNTLGWKVVKAVSKDSTVCKAANKKSYVKLSAKGEGRTTVRVTLKTTKRKGAGAVKKLSCRVNVKPVEVMPDTPEVPDLPEIETSKTVTDQAGLEQALDNKNITSITFHTAASGKFTIPQGDHANVDLTVNAPNADVENNAVFKSVTIQAIKENTWNEKAKGNFIKVLAEKAHVIVDASASVKEIIYAGTAANASVSLEVKGTVENINIQKSVKAEIVVAGTANVSGIACTAPGAEIRLDAEGTVSRVALQANVLLDVTGNSKNTVAVVVSEAAKGAQVKASAKVEISVKADIKVQLEKGAQGSKVEIMVKAVTVSVENKTGTAVDVKKADGTTSRVANNTTASVTDGQTGTQGSAGTSGSTYTPSTGSSSTGNGSSSGKRVIDLSGVTATVSGMVVVTGTALNTVENGVLIQEDSDNGLIAYGVITEGALKLKVSPINIPEGVQIEGGEERKKELESGLVIDLCQKGDYMPSHMSWRIHIGVISGADDADVYFDVILAKENWITVDGRLPESCWKVEKIDKKRFDELVNGQP